MFGSVQTAGQVCELPRVHSDSTAPRHPWTTGFFFFCTEAEACQQHKHQSLHLAVIDSTGGPQATPSCDVTIGSAIAHPRVGARATRRRLVTLLSR